MSRIVARSVSVAFLLVVMAACSSSSSGETPGVVDGPATSGVGEAVTPSSENSLAQLLVQDPTLFIQKSFQVDAMQRTGIDPGQRHDDFDDASLGRAVRESFERGEGRDLFILDRSLVPLLTLLALEKGQGDPSVLSPYSWTNSIDRHLDWGAADSGYEFPAEVSEAQVVEVLEAGVLPLLAESFGVDESLIDTKIVAEVVMASLTIINNDNSYANQSKIDIAHDELALFSYELATTLELAGAIIVDEASIEDLLVDEGTGPKMRAMLLVGDQGSPVMDGGKPVTASSWADEFSTYPLSSRTITG